MVAIFIESRAILIQAMYTNNHTIVVALYLPTHASLALSSTFPYFHPLALCVSLILLDRGSACANIAAWETEFPPVICKFKLHSAM
jgi:hypothetical protein